MKKSSLFFIIIFFLGISVQAQTLFSKSLEGKVTSDSKDVADVHVLNKTRNKATITNLYGYFSITASLNDTLLFSAVQFKKKELIVSQAMLDSKTLFVPLEDALNELDEVVVTPYDLSGDLSKDLGTLKTAPAISATSLGLPNAGVKPLMQSERLLKEASLGPFQIGMLTSLPFNPLINAISGRTKMLKKRVARDRKYIMTQGVQKVFGDTTYLASLKIPKEKLDDFMYYCEVDSSFQRTVNSKNELKIWEFLRKKSVAYRKNNELD